MYIQQESKQVEQTYLKCVQHMQQKSEEVKARIGSRLLWKPTTNSVFVLAYQEEKGLAQGLLGQRNTSWLKRETPVVRRLREVHLFCPEAFNQKQNLLSARVKLVQRAWA